MVTGTAVSVALCTHNGAKFIVEQLVSILEQSLPPHEVVLSDDASTDGTVDVAVEAFEQWKKHARDSTIELRVLRNPVALGVTKNFEQAILACSNEIVALSDQDDVWARDRLRVSVEALIESPDVLLVHGDARLIDEGGAVIGSSLFDALELHEDVKRRVNTGQAFEQFMRRNLVTGATATIRRGLAERAAPFPASWVHDEWLAMMASLLGAVRLLDVALIDYRQHSANQIGASRLSFRGKLGRLFEAGHERNRRLLDRATALDERMKELGDAVSPERLDATRQKLLHERVRASYSPSRWRRLIPVLREFSSGRYGDFGHGLRDVARDLLQPTKPSR